MSNTVQALPIQRKITVTQDLSNGQVSFEIDNTFAAPGVPIQESRIFRALINDTNGFVNQSMNAFVSTIQTLLPKPQEQVDTNKPIEELVDPEAAARIAQ